MKYDVEVTSFGVRCSLFLLVECVASLVPSQRCALLTVYLSRAIELLMCPASRGLEYVCAVSRGLGTLCWSYAFPVLPHLVAQSFRTAPYLLWSRFSPHGSEIKPKFANTTGSDSQVSAVLTMTELRL